MDDELDDSLAAYMRLSSLKKNHADVLMMSWWSHGDTEYETRLPGNTNKRLCYALWPVDTSINQCDDPIKVFFMPFFFLYMYVAQILWNGSNLIRMWSIVSIMLEIWPVVSVVRTLYQLESERCCALWAQNYGSVRNTEEAWNLFFDICTTEQLVFK